ncbi:hypothetical protein BJX63DRAFT_206776 [Aspergillus granulosus]|uniref:Uncharacterized protein n=1 Tax=Aspergillus granulosus TaxID=176169 RepID=A0ABR4HES0_9EURO
MTSVPELGDVIAERKERKRTQNRLNQRARPGLRLQQSKSQKSRYNGRPYRVDRWRLGDTGTVDDTRLERAPPAESLAVSVHFISTHDSGRTTPTASTSTNTHPPKNPYSKLPSLPADHLLTLIHLNACRGLRQNKCTLWGSTFYYMPSGFSYNASIGNSSHNYEAKVNSASHPLSLSLPRTIHPDTLFYGSSLITRVSNTTQLPETLIPTEPQMSLVHATWINGLPFPRMRENLIRWEAYFSHAEFVADLVGDLVDTRRLFGGPESDSKMHSDPGHGPGCMTLAADSDTDEDDDEITSNRNGLILWGEPYRVESWEATPGFLRKWMWVLEGCEELIKSTNRWRAVRGEGPIRAGWDGMGLVRVQGNTKEFSVRAEVPRVI